MTELKQSRWVKIHEPGQGDYDEHENVMDIKIGKSRCQAEALYTVRSYRKAGYWMLKYLEAAEATELLALAAQQIIDALESADREAPEVTVETEKWTCKIEKLSSGAFKTSLLWKPEGPVTRKQKPFVDKTVQKPMLKKRGRKKTEVK